MAYINLRNNEYPRYEGDIRLFYPEMGEKFVCPDDFAKVEISEIPFFDLSKEKVIEIAPKKINNVWVQQWKIVELSEDEKYMYATMPDMTDGAWYYDIENKIWIDTTIVEETIAKS